MSTPEELVWDRARVELYPDKAVREIERLRKLARVGRWGRLCGLCDRLLDKYGECPVCDQEPNPDEDTCDHGIAPRYACEECRE